MGYYTKYSLTIDSSDISEETLAEIHEMRIDDGYGSVGSLISQGIEAKWYRHEEDMRRISKLFPDAMFVLEGEGEESGDIWKEYYQAGKCQRCKGEVVFPPFDATKFK